MKKIALILSMIVLFTGLAFAEQNDFNITTADANTGVTFRAAVNAGLRSLATNSSGDSAPANPYRFQFWVNTTPTPKVLKMRNATNTDWIDIGTFTGTTFTSVSVSGTTVDIADCGCTGDGSSDDSICFQTCDATYDNILVSKPAGNYKISDNLSLTKSYMFEMGAKLNIDSGKVVSFAIPPAAGAYQIYMGAGKPSVAYAMPEHFGITGTADQTAINKCIINTGNYGTCESFAKSYTTSGEIIQATGTASDLIKNSLIFHGTKVTSTSTNNVLRIGNSLGTDGHTYYCTVSGIYIKSDTAKTGVMFDGRYTFNNTLRDSTIEGNDIPVGNSAGITVMDKITAPASGSYFNTVENSDIQQWDKNISIGYDWGNSLDAAESPNVFKVRNVNFSNFRTYGLYLKNGGYHEIHGFFNHANAEGATGGATLTDIYVDDTSSHNIFDTRHESGGDIGFYIEAGSTDNYGRIWISPNYPPGVSGDEFIDMNLTGTGDEGVHRQSELNFISWMNNGTNGAQLSLKTLRASKIRPYSGKDLAIQLNVVVGSENNFKITNNDSETPFKVTSKGSEIHFLRGLPSGATPDLTNKGRIFEATEDQTITAITGETGQDVIIYGKASKTLTFTDGANLEVGAGNFVLNEDDIIALLNTNGTKWIRLWSTNNTP